MSLRRRDLPEYDLSKPSQEEIALNTLKTKSQLETTINGKIAVSKVGSEALNSVNSAYYLEHNSNGTTKVIQMQEQQQDPMEPVKFSHRRVPRAPTDQLVPINRSPPRKLTAKDQQNWKIPPCISNWKNSKGYTIPIEMRLSADGRHLHTATVSQKFPKFAEALYTAEKNAHEEVKAREELQRKLALKEAKKKEEHMRELAAQARAERAKLAVEPHKRNREEEERNQIRYIRAKEIEREKRLENKKRKTEKERDVSEKVALGQVRPTQSSVYDQRLFNQSEGVGAGFASEDEYDVYDQPLFTDRSAAHIYRNVKSDTQKEGSARSKPVEFEQVHED